MRSVVNVKNELIRSTGDADFDVLTMTETWLRKDHHNNEFMSNLYRVFRRDRIDTDIVANRGGGVLIAVREDIDCDEHIIPEMAGLEAICVKFPLKKGNLFIYCLYIQPDANDETYK